LQCIVTPVHPTERDYMSAAATTPSPPTPLPRKNGGEGSQVRFQGIVNA
jgi:hypothetical protein